VCARTPYLIQFVPTSCPSPTKTNTHLTFPRKVSLGLCKKCNVLEYMALNERGGGGGGIVLKDIFKIF